jgi:NAD(P)H-flavin reductase
VIVLVAPAVTDILTEPMDLRPFSVEGARRETHDTWTLTLVAADGGPDLAFEPGQFTMLYVFGVGEVPLSISGNPSRPKSLIHTIRAVGSVTNAICALRAGDTVGIRGPYGSSWPGRRATGRDIVFVAGGIGLAPVRPAIYHVLEHREEYGTVSIVYGSRAPTDLLYTEEIHEWKARFDLNVQVTVDRGDRTWMGDVGVVTPLINRLAFDPEHTAANLCGPEIMMRVVSNDLVRRGLPASDISVSLERNVKCGIGFCGHCQIGSSFVCKDGPVVPYDVVADRLGMEEL